ncbi:MAG: cyclodeaminase/cyclohydrolase family protein [Firmicutes bacterium]|nr:cyclodeaminase/cyclohydrolase family protein [Bacillota bacterium]
MSRYFDKSYTEILAESKSSSPTPGGGSASAIVACMGNAMVSMVANLTSGKEKYAEHQDKVDALLVKTEDIMVRLEDLVDQDMQVFDKFMSAIKLPKGTDDEKKVRSDAIEAASIVATDVPLMIAETCVEIIVLASEICSYGNKGAISDVGVGAYVAEAAMHGAILSADINLGGIKNETYVKQATEKRNKLIETATKSREKAISIVRERM